jgi:S1-C subfamily serine protease
MDGSTWVAIGFDLFSPRERRVVYRATYEGSAQTGESRTDIAGIYRQAVTMAVRNLLADPKFHDNATRRASGVATMASLAPSPVVRRHAAGQTAAERMPMLQSAVVTVFTGTGSGSGFYVSAEGHLLTNQHVVGDSKFVKVKLANGREVLGEVLRAANRRDVALIKTEAVSLAPLDVAEAEPKIGDEVYALGSPLGDKLAGTVTRGVVSSFREIDQQRWLQSDVQVLPGSSGGPLVGGHGGVVGLTSRGLAGINLFVPIRAAMAELGLEFAK